MSRSSRSTPIGVGVVTVFMVLIVLCLAVFSALTLNSARADARLSQVRADSVSAWYAADAQAARLAAAFAASGEAELEAAVPISDMRELYVHLVRTSDGSVTVLAWQDRDVQTNSDGSGPELWDGTDPTSP